MKKKKLNINELKIRLHYVISLFVLVVLVVLTFLPIIPVENFIIDFESHALIPYYEYHPFFTIFIIYANGIGAIAFWLGASVIFYYLFTFLVVLFAIIGKRLWSKLFLLLATLSMIPTIFNESFANIHRVSIGTYNESFARTPAIIIAGAYLAILLLDMIADCYYARTIDKKAYLKKKEEMMRVGTLIKDKRKEAGLTQQQLADHIFVSRSLITKYEAGQLFPNRKTCESLSSELNIDFSEFDETINYEE